MPTCCANLLSVLGSAGELDGATRSGIRLFLRYGSAVEWTAEAIRKRRDELGLTQQELAARLNVSLRTITAWERGHSRPRRSAVLNEVLGAPPNSTAERLDLTQLSVDELLALNIALAYEYDRRLRGNGPGQRAPRPKPDFDPSRAAYLPGSAPGAGVEGSSA